MNTHKEPIKIGDTVSYLNQGEYEVVGLSTMMRDDPGEPEWKITHSIKEVAIADIYKGITYQKPCWVSVKDVAPIEPKETPHSESINEGHPNRYGADPFKEEWVELEPTPPSQIEEESQTQRSLREMYELGKEHGRTLALKDMEIEKLIKEINK